MPRYEYKIVPAPEKALKFKGLKSPARFAATIEQVMNEMGAEGWHYLRAETLPQEERAGLTSKSITPRNLLIFRRELPEKEITPPIASMTAASVPAPVAQKADEAEEEATLENVFDFTPDPPPEDPKGS